MTGFGEKNEELGSFSPEVISCREIVGGDASNNTLEIIIGSLDPQAERLFLQIRFEGYIMHLTSNESYTSLDPYEVRRGRYLCIYERSRFLDFYQQVTIHADDMSFPGAGVHYEICACDHIIDVITAVPPMVEMLDKSEVNRYE